MGILHDEMKRAIRERWTDASLMTELLRLILRNRGLMVPDEHLPPLVQRIMHGAENVEIPCDGPDQKIAITDEDIEQAMRQLEAGQEASADGTVMRVVEELAPSILQSLYDALPQALQEWHAEVDPIV